MITMNDVIRDELMFLHEEELDKELTDVMNLFMEKGITPFHFRQLLDSWIEKNSTFVLGK